MRKNQKGFSAVVPVVILLVVVVIGFAGRAVLQDQDKNTDQPAPNKFEYVSYANGLGQEYKLKFYTKYKVIKSPVSDTTSSPSKSSAKGLGLGSEVSNGGNLPIWLGIASKDLSSLDQIGQAQVENAKKCESNGFSKAFAVHNAFTKEEVNVCNVSSSDGDKKAAYLALFTYKSKLDVITIMVNSKNEPGKPRPTTNFTAYDDDIKTIISSIEIVSE